MGIIRKIIFLIVAVAIGIYAAKISLSDPIINQNTIVQEVQLDNLRLK